jgi:CheY-like chemotaxis protein
MAQQLGGDLVLKSRKGDGTTAELWIPVAEQQAGEPAVATSSAEQRGRRLVVLAVDDDCLVLFNTVAMLEELGHEVLEATTGKAALDLFQKRPDIDLIMTDQAMPGMTGLQLATAARTLRPEIKIVIATGYADLPKEADQSFRRLAKPFREQDLVGAIAGVIDT